jgi:hypothetical protein
MHKAPELPQINWLEQTSCGNNQLGMDSSIQAILENRVKVPFTTMATSSTAAKYNTAANN